MYPIKISTLSQKIDFDKCHEDLILQKADFEKFYENLISQILAKAAKSEKFSSHENCSLKVWSLAGIKIIMKKRKEKEKNKKNKRKKVHPNFVQVEFFPYQYCLKWMIYTHNVADKEISIYIW